MFGAKDEICVCCDCREPLIGTFLVNGHEWYCFKCKQFHEFLHFKSVKETPTLAARHKQLDSLFTATINGKTRPEALQALRQIDAPEVTP